MCFSYLIPFFVCGVCFVKTSTTTPVCEIISLGQEELAEAGGKGYGVSCRENGLTLIPTELPGLNSSLLTPPLRLFDIGNNNIKRLNSSAFEDSKNLKPSLLMWLFMDFNNINYVDSNAFFGLTELVYLNLSNNNLHWPGSFAPRVFQPLIKLKTLNLYGNQFNNLSDFGNELVVLKGSLIDFFFDAQENCSFGPGFERLTLLVNISLSSPSNQLCRLPAITNYTFQYIPQVQNIWMSSCQVKHIEPGAFAWFTELNMLDLSYNEELNFKGLNNALYGLRHSSTLKIINANHIYSFLEAGITIMPDDMKHVRTLHALETFSIEFNKIEVMDPKVLQDGYFPLSLRNLMLAGNRLTAGRYLQYLSLLESVTLLDISRQHLQDESSYRQQSRSNFSSKRVISRKDADVCPLNCSVCVPPQIVKVIWHSSFVYTDLDSIYVCGADNLQYLDMSFNLITGWNGPVTGLDNLKVLNISRNICVHISDSFFDNFKSLEVLDLSHNRLGYAFDSNNNNKSHLILQHLTQLQYLNMSIGRITKLHKDTFSKLVNLKDLRLSNNMLNEWSFDLSNSRCLNFLDLAGNKIETIPQTAMQYLDSLTKETCNINKTVTLNISMIPMVCSCDDLPFLKWIRDTKVKVHFLTSGGCHMKGKRYKFESVEEFRRVLHILEEQECLDRRCITYAVAVGCATAGVVLTGIIFTSVYKNRWKLRYVYYGRNRRYRHIGYERLFAYDAMISYAESRAKFVKDHLYPAMKNREITLWIADKDSQPGVSIAQNIMHAICNSRKVVLLVDSDYLAQSWCNFEMNMALVESVESQRKMMIFVLLETLDMDRLPRDVMRFLQSERSLEYPEHIQDVETFWRNLANEISS